MNTILQFGKCTHKGAGKSSMPLSGVSKTSYHKDSRKLTLSYKLFIAQIFPCFVWKSNGHFIIPYALVVRSFDTAFFEFLYWIKLFDLCNITSTRSQISKQIYRSTILISTVNSKMGIKNLNQVVSNYKIVFVALNHMGHNRFAKS